MSHLLVQTWLEGPLLRLFQIIYDGFEPIDVWGPLEFLTMVRCMPLCQTGLPQSTTDFRHTVVRLLQDDSVSYLVRTRSLQRRRQRAIGATSWKRLWLHSWSRNNRYAHLCRRASAGCFIVPGGTGVFNATFGNRTEIEDFLVRRFDQADYILGVSFGVTHLARSGLLNGKRATTNKSGWKWIVSYGPYFNWVPQARWVVDGKFWTSSGMAACMDMTYAWLTHVYGAEGPVNLRTNGIEYAPHLNPSWDPYAVYYNVSLDLVSFPFAHAC